MRLFAFKLSDGFYFRSGHAIGQQLHLADIIPESNMELIALKSAFIQMNIDPHFKLVEIEIKEK